MKKTTQGARMKFGRWFTKKRKAQGKSQADLNRELGVTPATINRIEKGQMDPPRKRLPQFAQALGVTYEEIKAVCIDCFGDHRFREAEARLNRQNEREFFVTVDDLKHLVTFAEGLAQPMTISVVVKLLRLRCPPSSQ